MTGRGSCVVLLLGLAACRTPQKNVSAYPLDDDDSGSVHHLQTGSDVGATVIGRMNLPTYADTETATNLSIAHAPLTSAGPTQTPVASESQPAPSSASRQPNLSGFQPEEERRTGSAINSIGQAGLPSEATGIRAGGGETIVTPRVVLPEGAPPVVSINRYQNRLEIGAAGPEKSTRPADPLHLPTAGNQSRLAEGTTQAAVPVNLRADRSSPSAQPVRQSIHLIFPSPANSVPRQPAVFADWQPGSGTGGISQLGSTRVNLPLGDRGCSVGALGSEHSIAVPVVGRPAADAAESVTQPVDLAPLLAVAPDADWRQRQADRQRAAETARQMERDHLEKSLQQFLQSAPK